MKITGIRTLKDVMDCGPFEGETLYNKALKYGRHDICLEIAETKRKTAEFEENIRKYEETGLQLYKDKATGRYYHMILWEEIICRLREELDATNLKERVIDELDATNLKERVIDELDLPIPYQFNCYACTAECEVCPIVERAGRCGNGKSAYAHYIDAINNCDKEAAIKYAEVIADAWTK